MKMKMKIKNFKYLMRFMRLFIYILNLEGLLYNLFNDLFFLFSNIDDIEKKKEIYEYKKEVERNIKILKFITCISLISWYNLSPEQIGCVGLSWILSEIIDKLLGFGIKEEDNIDIEEEEKK